MTTLARAVHIGSVFDQLNAPTLGIFEVLIQRMSQIIEAYSGGDASRPNWASVKHFVEDTSALNVVPKPLRQFAHRLAKEEFEAETLRGKSGFKGKGGDDAGQDEGSNLSRRQKAAHAQAKAKAADGKLMPPAAAQK